MPILGEEWGLINKFEKPEAGRREFDLRETTVLDGMQHASNKSFESSSEVSQELYALILRQENSIKIPNSNIPPLSRFRCYVFSGPHSEIPFNLESLGNPKSSDQSMDDYTIEMFPIFVCKNKEISNKLDKSSPGKIVKISYGNLSNFSEPLIVDVTSHEKMLPVGTISTAKKFKRNQDKVVQGNVPSLNPEDVRKKKEELRKESLRKTKNRSLKLKWPLPQHSPGSNFGPRISPIKQKPVFHRGIDIGARTGQDIIAPETGVVNNVSVWGGYGNVIVTKHKKNGILFYILFAHCSKVLVYKGKKIKQGDVIGKVGSTGDSTGPHLHMELRIGSNRRESAIDPSPHFEDG